MKKRNIFFVITAILAAAVFIFPTVINRNTFEQANKVYTLCINLDSIKKAYEKKNVDTQIQKYAENGFNAAMIDIDGDLRFDTDSAKAAKSAGLEIAACIYSNTNLSNGSISDFKKQLKELGIKYIMVKSDETSNKHNISAPTQNEIFDLIKDLNMTAVFAENKNQIGNNIPLDTEKYFEAANGKVMRAYETKEITDCTDKDYDRTYFEMLNSIRERNTKFMLVNQLIDTEDTDYNTERVARSGKRFAEKMKSLGYAPNKDASINGYITDSKSTGAATMLIALLMCLYILNTFMQNQNIYLDFIFYIGSLATFAFVYFFLPKSLMPLCATTYAIVMPCFCITFIFNTEQILKDKLSSAMLYAAIFALSAAIVLICSVPIGALLSGWKYYLGEMSFRGVKLALLLPVVYSIFFSYIVRKERIEFKTIKVSSTKSKLIFAICTCVALTFIVIYLKRSGDSTISQAEIKLRNFMADIFPVRPRTKDFLFAWPCLMLSVFSIKNSSSKMLNLALSVGASVVFASITNSFCHSFTDISIIYSRVSYGAQLGILTSVIFIFAAKKLSGR